MATVTIAEGSKTVGTPSSGDTLVVLGGGAIITTNLDQSALAAGLVRVEVSKAFTGDFGSSSGPLMVQISTALVYAASTGNMWYQAEGTGGDTAAIVQCIGGGHFHFVTGGTAVRFEVQSGIVTIAAAAIVTSLRFSGGNTTLIDDSSTDPTLVHAMPGVSGAGGTLYTYRGGTTFTLDAGHITIDAGTNVITTLNAGGATIVLKECGTITTANITGKVPDTSSMVRPLTITNTNINMSLPGAQAFLDNPLITFTNAAVRLINDGRIV